MQLSAALSLLLVQNLSIGHVNLIKVLSPATHESCIMSIFQNDKALIKKHCDFRFLINHLSSQIIEISKSEILVYQSD